MAAPRPTSGPMIETRDLRRTFKSRKSTVEAVRGVDLTVGTAEIFGFLGPNGAGKTTTLRMLATLLTPTAGEATIAGADLRREPETVRERIGYVPQGGSTDPAETGRGELVIQGRLYGLSAAAAKARAAEVLAALDLEAAADRATGTYSGGMRRRLDVGLGIVHRPGGPVPRRAHDRSRPAGAGPDVGRDPCPARARHDRLPDDPLPRGGGRPGRPAGDHRPRPDRGRRARPTSSSARSPATS